MTAARDDGAIMALASRRMPWQSLRMRFRRAARAMQPAVRAMRGGMLAVSS
jgi:hypothetical protein